MFYVYELIDPRDDKPFYVGKGKGNRIDQHEAEARKGRQSRKCDRIREIEADGMRIIKRKVSSHKEELDAFRAEEELIALYGHKALTNIMSGGRGGRSLGPTSYEDRRAVAEATALLKRCGGRDDLYIQIGDSPERFYPVAYMKGLVERVIKRRSLPWVNEIAQKYHVEYKQAA